MAEAEPRGEVVASRREAGGIAVITIDRPERRNALNLHVKERLARSVEDLAADPAVRVIVLTGADGVFVAGTDIAEMATMTPTEHTALATDRVFTVLRQCPKPLVAAVEGPAPSCKKGGSVTAGNVPGVNDGTCAIIVASEAAAKKYGLTPRARVVAAATAGVAPRIMSFGPAPETRKVLENARLPLGEMDASELNEAFAQAPAVTRDLGLLDDAEHVSPNGGAVAIGHSPRMSGARLRPMAVHELHRQQARYALITMCIGVGQCIAMMLEHV